MPLFVMETEREGGGELKGGQGQGMKMVTTLTFISG